jgi:hypothetical protein
MSLLLNLKRVIGGSNVNNLTQLIMQSLMDYGGLIIDQIHSKLICFGSNGVAVFIRLQIGVATQSKSKIAFFVIIYMHCMAQ